ncbi:acylphosphatase [Pseudaminobacter sp. 19-2017]|uniref:Acylphosphatase n=1 Tax=Pseudaminobacter soli (ex Zhang et al. 2022) TaxID=2831468 RepID=A0A942DY28_9HYPH|nr:acylphosphatase [Pseudaminobacter soli]MBS3647471.1 acylphosphatase [Pseudaminobacter soli]
MTEQHASEILKVRIRGRVQGVGFRFWTRDEAQSLGISGWVRNEPDGSVTALLAGDPATVRAMLERLHQGPPGSRVVDVVVEEAELEEFGGSFEIVR